MVEGYPASDRCLRPSASICTLRLTNRDVSGERIRPNAPRCSTARTTFTAPSPSLIRRWPATNLRPDRFVSHTNDHPGVISVTVHTIGESRGCLIRAWLPITNGPLSSRVTFVIDGDHSGQRSTSVSTPHTLSSEELIVIEISNPMTNLRERHT